MDRREAILIKDCLFPHSTKTPDPNINTPDVDDHRGNIHFSVLFVSIPESVPMRLSRKPIAVGTVRSRFGLAGNYGLVALL